MAEVIVFGSGPSGLMAAHAAESAGHEVVRLWDASPKPPDGKSAGVFYLHEPCGLDVRSQIIRVSAEGDKREYARRVYGDADAPCNWPTKPYEVEAWDGMAAVQMLWTRYADRVFNGLIDISMLQSFAKENPERIYISTVPLDAITEEQLPSARSQILTLDPGQWHQALPHMTYMGLPSVEATRHSYLFGRYAMEAPMDVDWSGDCSMWHHHVVRKVMPSVYAERIVERLERCHPNLLLTGRYGRWDKSVLTHKVYRHVKERLSR